MLKASKYSRFEASNSMVRRGLMVMGEEEEGEDVGEEEDRSFEGLSEIGLLKRELAKLRRENMVLKKKSLTQEGSEEDENRKLWDQLQTQSISQIILIL